MDNWLCQSSWRVPLGKENGQRELLFVFSGHYLHREPVWRSFSLELTFLSCGSSRASVTTGLFAFIFSQVQADRGFPGGSAGEEPACNARGDMGSIPGSGRSPREGNGYPLQYSCPENSMDRGAWRATVHGIAKRRTWLGN